MKSGIDKFLMDQAKETGAGCQETCEEAQAKEGAVTEKTEVNTLGFNFTEKNFQVSNIYENSPLPYDSYLIMADLQKSIANSFYRDSPSIQSFGFNAALPANAMREPTIRDSIDSQIRSLENAVKIANKNLADAKKRKEKFAAILDFPASELTAITKSIY